MAEQPTFSGSRSLKIRSHTRQRAKTKPYARVRSSERKRRTLFDTVKEYLSPSWFFGYLRGNEQENCSDSDEEGVEEDINVVDNAKDVVKQTLTQNNSQTAYENHLNEQGHLLNNLEKSTTHQPDDNLAEKTNNATLSRTLSGELHDDEEDYDESEDVCSTTTLPNLPESKQFSSVTTQQFKRKPLTSMFHLSTPSSSQFQPHSTPHNLQNPPTLSLSSLTSRTRIPSYPTTPGMMSSTVTMDTSRQEQPSSAKPGFSVSTFVKPVQKSFGQKRTGSPFYPGPTMYGGASGVKRQRRESPKQETKSYQTVRKQRIMPKELPSTNQQRSTTQTAQRILKALESFSSPLKDVRKIPSPNVSTSPLSFSVSSKSRMLPPRPQQKLGPKVSLLQSKFLPPPVQSLSIPEKAKILRTNDNKDNTLDSSMFAGLKDTVLKTSLPTGFVPKPLPTSLSPIENIAKTSVGKMRSVSRGASHYSSATTTVNDEVINPMPEITHAVPLPFNKAHNLGSTPLFKTDKDPVKNMFKPQTSESPKNGFIFSTPKPKPNLSVKDVLAMADDEVSTFSFSQPAPMKPLLPQDKSSPKQKAGESKLFLSPADKTSSTTATITATTTSTNTSSSKPSMLSAFALKPGQWECSVCMIHNKATDAKCIACENTAPNKQTHKSPPITTFSKNILNQNADTWECGTCLVRNKSELSTCLACMAMKPGAKTETTNIAAKFAAKPNSWECDVCLVQNKTQDVKCVACTNPKPGSTGLNTGSTGSDTGSKPANTSPSLSSTTTSSWGAKFAPAAGSWECDTCMLSNKATALKCVACETAKPGNKEDIDSASNNNSGSSSSTSNKNGFTFGAIPIGATTNKPPSVGGFQFGTNVTISSSSSEATTFKFGTNNDDTKSGTTSFKFGSTIPSPASTSTNVEAPSSTNTTVGTSDKATFKFGSTDDTSLGTKTNTIEQQSGNTSTGTVAPSQFGSATTDTSKTMTSTSQFMFGAAITTSGDTDSNQPASSVPPLSQSAGKPTIASGVQSVTATTTMPSTSETEKAPSFTFGTDSVATNTFTFGGQKATPVKGGFTFGKTEASENKPGNLNIGQAASLGLLKVPAKDESSGNQKDALSLPVSKPEAAAKVTPFSFSGSSVASIPTSSTNTPAFGLTTKLDATDNQPTSNTATFNFGSSNTITTTTQSPALFQFGKSSSATPVTSDSSTSVVPSFSFTGGTTAATEVKTKPAVFSFGRNAAIAPAVVAASVPNPAAQQAKSQGLFTFSANQPFTTNPATSGTTNSLTQHSRSGSLGGEDMDADSNNNHDQPSFGATTATGGFNFTGQLTSGTTNMFGAAPSGTPSATGLSFGAGTTGTTPSTFPFGGTPKNVGTIPSTFPFGGTPKNATPSGAFSFGSSTTTPVGNSPFAFGAGTNNNPPNALTNASNTLSFGAPQTNTGTPAGTFSFNRPSATAAAGGGVPTPGNQPVMFNVGSNKNVSSRAIKKAVRRRR